MKAQPIKLNLGSGDKPLTGYINLDAKHGDTVSPIWRREGDETYGDAIDEIRASHILEHFPHSQTQNILSGWVSKLKPGGILKIAVPDFREIAKGYLEDKVPLAESYLMGGQSDEYDYHKALFDEPGLRKMMEAAGLVDIQPWTSEIRDCAALSISLNLMGTKPAVHPRDTESTEKKENSQIEQPEPVSYTGRRVATPQSAIPLKIAAVMSVPRLSITNNVASMYRAIRELGIMCRPGQGVFWHHVLTRQLEDRIADGFDYLLAVDYDSWFLPGHVMRLVELLVQTPGADAICAVQCAREGDLPIIAIHDESGLPVCKMPRTWFEQPLTPIHIGNFGLTLFRAACFSKLARPWFRDEPDPNGSYREGRKDADVAFWGNFERSGCRLFLANEVNIGHLQEVCTFPGPRVENWKPIHAYLRDLNAGQIPVHCDPRYRITGQNPNRKE